MYLIINKLNNFKYILYYLQMKYTLKMRNNKFKMIVQKMKKKKKK